MSRLTIVGYDDPDEAEEVRLKLRKLQREYVMDLKDAVVAVRDEQGKALVAIAKRIEPYWRLA